MTLPDPEAVYLHRQARVLAHQQGQQASTTGRVLPDPATVYARRRQQAAANTHREG